MNGLCKECETLKKTGKAVLVYSTWHLIQLKHDAEYNVVYLCFQSRDGEVQFPVEYCPQCGRPYHGLGGFLND